MYNFTINQFAINRYSTYPDIKLLLLLKDNDPLAFAEIYERYCREIFNYAMALVKIPELAKDLVQDVFIKIWEARGKIEVEKSFRSYLFRVCHNRAYDMQKEIAQNRILREQLVNYYEPVIEPEALSQEGDTPYMLLLKQALSSLTPQRRRIYEMCKNDKKSYDEVARELNISPNTVKNHMTNTLSFLRDYLRQHSKLTPLLIWLLQKIF
ncbi:RNA polymerase sigma-70 factor [Chitinophaga sp. G-6-1-13]|uniref:RNA polymerase sigma-70 factor n=1 Tax=Chitinophaga fulva TaxID=2728842 RepID=A0A848GTN5_9BACT|nr:RNA polymerase sigma-70 factor [Chitinophaga fulva]NML40709.1 RNA polymerase sigma-70 factor [Chitinophaga fulva]